MESNVSTIQRPQQSRALPQEWTERLLIRFTSRYGHRFTSQITTEPQRLDWIETWSKDLSELSAHEIKMALELSAEKFPSWPPTSMEFRHLVRPPVDYERLFAESANAMSTGRWPDKLAYWSAYEFGEYDMRRLSYQQAKDRWARIVDSNLGKDLMEIPEAKQALPAPGQTMSPQVAEEAIKAMRGFLNTMKG